MGVKMTHCCGFTLKHGTIIIGVVQSILAFMFMVLSASYAEYPQELIDMSDPSIVPTLSVLRCILIILAVGSALQSIFSILLIFAAEMNNPRMIVPWLILNPTALVVYIIGTFVAIVHHTGLNNMPFIVGHLLFAIIITLIVVYQMFAVWNFYKHLKTLNF